MFYPRQASLVANYHEVNDLFGLDGNENGIWNWVYAIAGSSSECVTLPRAICEGIYRFNSEKFTMIFIKNYGSSVMIFIFLGTITVLNFSHCELQHQFLNVLKEEMALCSRPSFRRSLARWAKSD